MENRNAFERAITKFMSCSTRTIVTPFREFGDQRRHPLRLFLRHPGCRFVEKEKLRAAGKGDPDLEVPLETVGELRGPVVFLLDQVQSFEDLRHPVIDIAEIVDVPPEVVDHFRCLGRQPHVFKNAQLWENVGDLVRPANAPPGDDDGGRRVIFVPLNQISPRVGGILPAMRLKNVVFPAPFGPMTDLSSPVQP